MAPNDSQNSRKKIECANKIRENIIDGYRVMIILRGLPGSGKSTMAKDFCALTLTSEPKNFIFSTDDYFLCNNGKYQFDPSHLQDAHSWNQARVQGKAKIGWSPIIVDNTHTQVWEMMPYIKVAIANGYFVELLEPDTPWVNNPRICANNNIHKVGLDTIQKMHQRYEPANIEAILKSFNIRYKRYKKPPQESCTKHLVISDETGGEFDTVTSEAVSDYNSVVQPAINEENEEDNAWGGSLPSSDHMTIQSVYTDESKKNNKGPSVTTLPIVPRLREVTLNDSHSHKKIVLPRLEMVNHSEKGYFVKETWITPQEDADPVSNHLQTENSAIDVNYSDWGEPVAASWDEPSTSTSEKEKKPVGPQPQRRRKKPKETKLKSSEIEIPQVPCMDKHLEPFVCDDKVGINFHIILGIQCIEKLKSQFGISTSISKQMVSVVTVPYIMALQLYSYLEDSEFRQWKQEQQYIEKHDELLAYLLEKLGNDLDDSFDLSLMDDVQLTEAMNDFLSQQSEANHSSTYLDLGKEDHVIELNVGFECATQLKCIFGSDYDISNFYNPVISLPFHLALQLHLLWEQSVHEQWCYEQYEITKTDEQMARKLQNEENCLCIEEETKVKKEEPFQKVMRTTKKYKGVNFNPNLPVDSQRMLLVAHLEHHNKGVGQMERRIALYNELGRNNAPYSSIRIRDAVQECENIIQQEFYFSAGNFVDYTIKCASPRQIDLHLLFVVEATFAVNMFLDQHIMMMRSNNQQDVTLEFITGQGLHSRHGKPKIRPAVNKILKERRITPQTVFNNNGILTAKVFTNSLLKDEIE